MLGTAMSVVGTTASTSAGTLATIASKAVRGRHALGGDGDDTYVSHGVVSLSPQTDFVVEALGEGSPDRSA